MYAITVQVEIRKHRRHRTEHIFDRFVFIFKPAVPLSCTMIVINIMSHIDPLCRATFWIAARGISHGTAAAVGVSSIQILASPKRKR